MTDRYAPGARQSHAVWRARAALADLGDAGVVDLGTRRMARGGTRERRTVDAPQGVWYVRTAPQHTHTETTWEIDPRSIDADADAIDLRSARVRAVRRTSDVQYHYAPTWARMPADSHRAPQRVRQHHRARVTVALPLRDVDSGRPVHGAVVGADMGTRRLFGATDHALAGVRYAARVARRRAVTGAVRAEGCGL